MSETSKLVHTAKTRTTGGREHGISRSSDGRLDVRLSTPASERIGINPEHLFASAWSASLETAIELAARQRKIALPAGIMIDAEVDLNITGNSYFISARFTVDLPGIEPAVARDLIDDARGICPYSNATRGNMAVAIRLIE